MPATHHASIAETCLQLGHAARFERQRDERFALETEVAAADEETLLPMR